MYVCMYVCIYLSIYLSSPRGVLANVLDYFISVNEFELRMCFYVHFCANAPGKSMKRFITTVMGYIFFFLDRFGIE